MIPVILHSRRYIEGVAWLLGKEEIGKWRALFLTS
jgi:hypothetical protein